MSERVATIERTQAASVTRCNVSDTITEQAGTRPDATAIIEQATGRRITFGELERTIHSLAAGLTQYGICSGTRAVLAVRPGIEFVALVFALFRAAAVPIVVDPGMGRKNMLACIGEAKPEALIGISAAHALSKVFRKPFASVTKRVTVGRRWFWGGKTYSQLASVDASSFKAPQTRASDLAAILFTSGATGVPKGVEYEHGMFDGQVRAIRDYFEIKPGEVDVPCFALFALFTVAMGCTIVLPDIDFSKPGSCDPAKIVTAIEQHKASLTFGSPAVWARVAPWLQAQSRKFPESLRRILIAGASVPLKTHEALAELLPNGRVHTPYGATESLPVACIDGHTLLEKFATRMKSGEGTCVGKPLPGVDVHVIPVGAQHAAPLPAGEIGEIIVSSATTTRGYFNKPEQTAASKISAASNAASGFFHRMGDVGYLDAEGNLWFCGRANHVVHTAEGPLYPDQVEGVFSTMDGVERCALIPRAGAACVVVDPGRNRDHARVASRKREELLAAAAKLAVTRGVKYLIFDDNFPLDVRHNAKIDRIALARRHALPVGGKGGLPSEALAKGGITMKILVTGGNGFLGSRIVERLVARGHEVSVFARSANPKSKIENPKSIAGDLCNQAEVADAVQDHEAVFHVAAKAGVWGRRRDYFDTNVTGTRNVVAACGVHSVKSLIYTSTPSVVFNAASLEGVNEDAPYATRFLTHYAETKCMAEKEVLAANGVGALRTVALRPHLIWGKGDPHLVPRVLARAKAGRLKRVGDGSNKVDITHVEDAADAHLLALEHVEAAAGKVYFISSEAVLLWEWLNTLLSRMGLPPVTRSISRGLAYKIGATFEFLYGLLGIASEPPMTRFVAENLATSHWFDISRARKDLGYSPKHFGVAALDDYLQTEKAHASH